MSTMPTHDKSRLIAQLFRRLAREMEFLSDVDLERLINERRNILSPPNSNPPEKFQLKTTSPLDIERVKQKLLELTDREQGERLLSSEVKNRVDLAKLARAIDVPVTKRHTVAQITDKIIEATIGYKTRSAAIRGDGPA